jgi:hypothetical protein
MNGQPQPQHWKVLMSSHTPGPYLVDDGFISIQQQADCLIKGIGTEREWTAIGITDQDGGVAEVVALCHPINAHLIAAAPELLEALQSSVGCLEASLDEVPSDAREAIENDLVRYRAAIAKATQPPSK